MTGGTVDGESQERAERAPRASRLALASFALGLVGIVPPLGIVAWVLGIMAGRRICRSEGALAGLESARAGVVLGEVFALLNVATLCALSFIVPPSPPGGVQRRSVTCRNNLRQVGLAMLMYADDYSNKLPLSLQALTDEGYVKDPTIFLCPSRFAAHPIDPSYIDVTGDFYYARPTQPIDPAVPTPIAWDKEAHIDEAVTSVLFDDGRVAYMGVAELEAAVGSVEYEWLPPMPAVPPLSLRMARWWREALFFTVVVTLVIWQRRRLAASLAGIPRMWKEILP